VTDDAMIDDAKDRTRGPSQTNGHQFTAAVTL
jgi:hypothetical protein